MCSKKCANPVLPGSTSFREPVWTGIWSDTMSGKPVSTTMTRSPLPRVVSVVGKGRRGMVWRLSGRGRWSTATVRELLARGDRHSHGVISLVHVERGSRDAAVERAAEERRDGGDFG